MTTIAEAIQIATQHRQANNLTKAEQIYRQVIDIQPNQPEALYGLGVLAQQVGNHQNAQKWLNATLLVQPQSFKAWFSLGNSFQAQGQFPEAVGAYQQALNLQPKLAPAYNNLGYIWQQHGLWEKAIAAYQKTLQLQPGCTEAEVNLANAFHSLGKLPTEKQGHYAILNHDLGVAQHQGGNLNGAITYYQYALDLQSNLAMAHYNLAMIWEQKGFLAEAMEAYHQALELSRDTETSLPEPFQKLIKSHLGRLEKLNSQSITHKPKVAFVCQPFVMTKFPKPTDSIGIITYELARLLVADCDVSVYAPGRNWQQESHETIDYHYIPVGADQWLLKNLSKLPGLGKIENSSFGANWYYLGYILRIAQDLRKRNIEIVHIHNLAQFIPVIRAFNPDIKIILHMHCEWLTQLNQKALKQRLDKVDLVISPSEYITQGIQTRFPEIAQRCYTVPNGVTVERFINTRINRQKSPSNGGKHLLFVGRVCPEKGAHILLEAFQKVLASYPQTQLTLVGPIGVIPYEYLVGVSEDAKVQELAHFHQENSWQSYLQTKLAQIQEQGGKVSLPGLVPPSKLNSYFHNADIFIFPSICHEAFGMPIVEAMSAGLPVVATQGGAFPEIVEEGKTGLLVERSDSEALATAIIKLIENEDLRASMGKLGLEKAVDLYSFETMADNLLAYFNKD